MIEYKHVQINLSLGLLAVYQVLIHRYVQHNSVDNFRAGKLVYDYIVVGGGSAGCVVARRLSDDRHNVLLLEAGRPQSFLTDLPGIEQDVLRSGQFNWNLEISPQQHVGRGRATPGVFRENKGLVFGGTSVINRMVYLRPNPRDFYEWEHTYGAKGWSFEDVLPHFIKSENNTDHRIVSENPEYHGMDGLLSVTTDPNSNTLLKIARNGYVQLGIPITDLNGRQQAGTNIVQLTTKDGFRDSTANAFLEPNPNPKNLFISLNSYVTRIIFGNSTEGLTAQGVQFVKNNHRFTVRATKEVILCAGSYYSPQLLMLSGIGPKEHLEELGIHQLLDLQVGENLQDHPSINFWLPIVSGTPIGELPSVNSAQIYQLITRHDGPLATSSALYTYLSTASNADSQWPNIVFSNRVSKFSSNITQLISEYSAQRAQEWTNYFQPYIGEPYLTINIFLRRVRSTGRVRLSSTNPYSKPIIDPKYLQNSRDFDDMVEGVKSALSLLQNSKVSENVFLIPKPIPGCQMCPGLPVYECDSYIRCYIRQIGNKEHHTCGTCRMGAIERSDTVVDPCLRVKYTNRLRVCDTSVIPHIPNSNLNSVAIMIGEKCAHHVLESI